MEKALRNATRVLLILILIFGAAMGIRLWIIGRVCVTEEKLNLEISGVKFEVEDVSCDTLAKDEAVSVYAQNAVSKAAWFFPGWRGQRSLLFKYDPERWDSPPPSISLPSKSTILISIPHVSEIFYQSHKWGDMSVAYDVGRVDYPSASK